MAKTGPEKTMRQNRQPEDSLLEVARRIGTVGTYILSLERELAKRSRSVPAKSWPPNTRNVAIPALPREITAMTGVTDSSAIGLRDKALVLVGFAGALRLSELVALNKSDCTFSKHGVRLNLGDRKITITYGSDTCPVQALLSWMSLLEHRGPVFCAVTRHGTVTPNRLWPGDVNRIIKKLSRRAGLRLSGRSLRFGHVITAAAAGLPEWYLVKQTGYHSAIIKSHMKKAAAYCKSSALGL